MSNPKGTHEILRHAGIKTTARYLHAMKEYTSPAVDPLDPKKVPDKRPDIKGKRSLGKAT